MPESDRYEHFQIVRREDGSLFELGRGAMGVTYKALDVNLHSAVALKVINAKYLNNEVARERFLREARATAQLRHRNVASVFHLGSSGDNCFYAMEFIDGITVDAMVRREGPLELEQALRIALQVSRALVAAERHQLVHRDIKPSNLMLVAEDGELVVKVIDFGLARPANSVPEGGFQGSPQFASPEQIEQRPTDSRSDIYSLGATIWFVVTGRPLFTGNIHEVFDQQISKPPPLDLIRNFPTPVVNLIESMLAKDPGKRPATAADLRSRVEQCIDAVRQTGSTLVMMLDEHGKAPETSALTTAATHSVRPAVGSLLAGRYRVTRDLGIRSAGRVFQTVDMQTKRAVCINMLDPELEQFAGGILQIQEDATRLKIQGHTNLLQVFNVQVNEGVPLVAVEWANGFPLIDLLRVRGKINAVETLPILIQAARAIDFCAENQYRGLLIGLNQILIHFPGDPVAEETITEILKRPSTDWPPYLIKLHALGPSRQDSGSFTWDGGATLDTFSRGDTSSGSDLRSVYLKCLAEVAYELYGGLRGVGGYASGSESVRYTPLPALSEQGNAALRRALASNSTQAGYPSCVTFVEALRTAIEADFVPSSAVAAVAAVSAAPVAPATSPFQVTRQEDPDLTIEIPEHLKTAAPMMPTSSPSLTISPAAHTSSPTITTPKAAEGPSLFKIPATTSKPPQAKPSTPAPVKIEPVKIEPASVPQVPPPARPAPAPPGDQEQEPEPKKTSTVLILAIVVALGLLGTAAGLVMFRPKPSGGEITQKTPMPSATPQQSPQLVQNPTPIPEPTPVPIPTPTATPPPPTPVPTLVPTTSRLDQFELAVAALASSGARDPVAALPKIVDLASQFSDVPNARESVEGSLEVLHTKNLPAQKVEPIRALLQKLAAEGYSGAMLNLGDLTRESDPAEASTWYQKAAGAGSSAAMVQIGLMLAKTPSVPDYLKKAVSWFEKAAAANDPEGQFLLGECFYYGNGTKKDPEKAVSLLQRAVEGGNPRAMDLLGAYYVSAPEGSKDYRKAADLFNRSQELGNLNALANLGVLYVRGLGVTEDRTRAKEMFQRGAEAGNPACMYFYGGCYEDGIGVEKNVAEARKWYVKAAKGGNAYAIQWCKENGAEF